MGTRPRSRPKRLAAKLFAIRKQLGLSQSELATQLEFDKGAARISEYESGARMRRPGMRKGKKAAAGGAQKW